MFFVSGGYDHESGSQLDSTELFDPTLGSWTTSGAKLPQPMSGLRAVNINDHVLIFGNDILIQDYCWTMCTCAHFRWL